MRNVQKAIDDIIDACTGKTSTCTIGRLLPLFAEFLHLAALSDEPRDHMNYPDPPEHSVETIRSLLAAKCSALGSYEMISPCTGRGKKETRNALDDAAAVVSELMKIKWYFEKTGKRNGSFRLGLAMEGGLARAIAGLIVYFVDAEALR